MHAQGCPSCWVNGTLTFCCKQILQAGIVKIIRNWVDILKAHMCEADRRMYHVVVLLCEPAPLPSKVVWEEGGQPRDHP